VGSRRVVSPAEPVRAVVLVLDGNDEIDITTAEQLGKLAGGLKARNVPLGPGPRARPDALTPGLGRPAGPG
jgi:hypothetical protein